MNGRSIEFYKETLVGKRFGSLVVESYVPTTSKRHYFKCLCDCGELKNIRQDTFLGKNKPVSCGCKTRENINKANITHGLSKTPEYRNYRSMIARCHHENSGESFARYGAKGIYVCSHWRLSFVNFLSDMGERPSPSHSIDRIDNNKGYTPENCRWASKKEQAINRSATTVVTIKGISDSLSGHSKKYGISAAAIRRRLTAGFTEEMIISKKRFGKWCLSRYGIGDDSPAFEKFESEEN